MRKCLPFMLIVGSAFLVLAPNHSDGQGKKGGGGVSWGGDPGERFDKIANNRASVPVSEIRTMSPQVLLQFVQEKGITNGMINKQQYIEYQDYARNKMMAGFNMGGGKGNKGGKDGGNPFGGGGNNPFGKKDGGGKKKGFESFGPGSTPTQPAAPVNPDLIKQLAEASFKTIDANSDGKLNADEMPPRLKDDLAKWDKNKDGLIELSEYRDFFAAQLIGGGADPSDRNAPRIFIEDDELDKKPIVFRADGKLPPGVLPAWFKELDSDKDGQVALYEWRQGNKELGDFKNWDINDDGCITMDEAVKVFASAKGANGSSAPGAAFGQRPSLGSGFPGGDGGFGKKGKKKGG